MSVGLRALCARETAALSLALGAVTAGAVYALAVSGSTQGAGAQAASAAATGSGRDTAANGKKGGDKAVPPAKTFTISGSIAAGSTQQLVPGVRRTLVLELSNDVHQAIRVTSLTVTASSASEACPASAILLGSAASASTATESVDIPLDAGGSAAAPFAVQLASTATDACKDTTWTLEYTGQGIQG